LFVVCTAAGLAAVRGRAHWSEARALLAAAPGWLLGVGLAQAALDQILGGVRMWACARGLGERAPLRDCVAANCANVFLGGVTPSQSGGGPAQIWLLWRGGLSLAAATVTSACTFLGTIATFLVLALHVVCSPASALQARGARLFTSGTVTLFAVCLVASMAALLRPGLVHGPLRALVARVPRWGRGWAAGERFRGLQVLVNDGAQLLGRGMRRGKRWLFLGLVLSFAVYANKFSIAWTVLRGLGVSLPLPAVLRSQELQYLVTYFAPTPGASGFAEYSAARLLGELVSETVLGAYLIAWRAFTLYVGMVVGAMVLVRAASVASRPPPGPHAGAPAAGASP
jgi:uncharacterized membrane protein YbhN (UPF0104 family)